LWSTTALTWPLIGLAIRKVGHLVVDRTRLAGRHACVLAMRETLRQGMSVMVFPEGTIHRSGAPPAFRPGAFRIAVEGGRPVVPISLRGTRHVLPGNLWLFRRGCLDVTIHAPIEPVANGRQEVVRLRDCARREIFRES
jgi:1-acyl-sn-glycerol-3-phosphate acyltransferase